MTIEEAVKTLKEGFLTQTPHPRTGKFHLMTVPVHRTRDHTVHNKFLIPVTDEVYGSRIFDATWLVAFVSGLRMDERTDGIKAAASWVTAQQVQGIGRALGIEIDHIAI